MLSTAPEPGVTGVAINICRQRSLMKQFGDFIPVAVFFLVYLFSRDLFLATGVLMAVTTAQVAIVWFVRRQVEKPLLYTAAAVLVLGGLTVALHDEMNLVWAVFFASVGALNLFVAYQFDEATWVNFRFFGLMGLNAIFFISQFVWLSRYMSALDEKA